MRLRCKGSLNPKLASKYPDHKRISSLTLGEDYGVTPPVSGLLTECSPPAHCIPAIPTNLVSEQFIVFHVFFLHDTFTQSDSAFAQDQHLISGFPESLQGTSRSPAHTLAGLDRETWGSADLILQLPALLPSELWILCNQSSELENETEPGNLLAKSGSASVLCLGASGMLDGDRTGR